MKTDVQREHSESMWLREDVIWMSQEQWDWYMEMLGGTISEAQDPPIILESSPYAEGEGLLRNTGESHDDFWGKTDGTEET